MLLEFPGISPVPSLHFPPITVHESIRSFNVQHNGQGELFCDHNARKRYLSAKNVRTTEAPGPGNNQWGSRSRCPPPVKISYRDMQREGLGVSLSTAAATAAGEQLNHKSHNCSTSLFTAPTTRLWVLKHRQSHARGTVRAEGHICKWLYSHTNVYKQEDVWRANIHAQRMSQLIGRAIIRSPCESNLYGKESEDEQWNYYSNCPSQFKERLPG